MRSNLELNKLRTDPSSSERFIEDRDVVQCIHLPWEYASETDVHVFRPEIVLLVWKKAIGLIFICIHLIIYFGRQLKVEKCLGADVIYDPSCLPHLVRLLAILLNQRKSYSQSQQESSKNFVSDSKRIYEINGPNQRKGLLARDLDRSTSNGCNDHGIDTCNRASNAGIRQSRLILPSEI